MSVNWLNQRAVTGLVHAWSAGWEVCRVLSGLASGLGLAVRLAGAAAARGSTARRRRVARRRAERDAKHC